MKKTTPLEWNSSDKPASLLAYSKWLHAEADAPMTLFILRETLSFPRLVLESQTRGIL
jgi:hypothetical protein